MDSGSWVSWRSLDGVHTATDADWRDACFSATFTRDVVGRAYFVISDGALYAMSENDPMERCDGGSVKALPDGSFAIDYICNLHHRMTGTLLVR